ncbi:MAG: SCO family protein [Planctomycetota bacterium]|nr:SCO family protein [Planctomycetota bacterium]
MSQSILPALFLAAALAAGCHEHGPVGAAGAEGASCCAEEAPAAVGLGDLPQTSLYLLEEPFTDQSGATFELADLRGKPVVAAMIFTNCSYACPRILADLRSIEAGLSAEQRSEVRFLLVSMDTLRDTPEVLANYATEKQLDTSRWTLLHGSDFAVRGIAAALGVRYKRDVNGDFAHSNLITVLDQGGRIEHQLEGLNADTSGSLAALVELLP